MKLLSATGTETSNTRILARLLLDVFVGLLLFILACVIAGIACEYLTPNAGWLYLPWFAIGLLPFFFYARYRGVCSFSRWDIVAYSPIPLALGIFDDWLTHRIAFLSTVAVLFVVCVLLRRLLPSK